ncbi:MAG: LytTR family transcriptional regulator [Lewinellaceae bacterium]|nr:LytTR family transcriptional regulator [Lewinellaceae bacterium]
MYIIDGRKRVISRTLKDFEEILLQFHFFRPHHSHLINLAHVREFVRGDGGYLVMENKMKIPVSKSREGLLGNN